jgi:hypothetical protein
MSGLHLASMEASDLLDVLHYLFEEDLRVSSGEEAKAVEESRKLIYGNLYNRPYKYARTQSNSTSTGGDSFDDFAPITPYTPSKPKPYIPPTDFDPNSGIPGLIEPTLG